ncbi:hypothetical protein RhiirA4_476113 [Rhizophagus irregularis]|uniref:Uncharacterized protein n=1 Tax=Rhizophagus irregularis TaxID=588596 RepID=A0A2I1HB41_9GLOM|nr:hypothetical protein RhiirA4_476113 [Rhizophagus irregularis]
MTNEKYLTWKEKTIIRLWCRLAIPLLREDPFPKKDPFSREYLENQQFIEIYLSKIK